MEKEDKVWALLALLFAFTPWCLNFLLSKPYANLNLLIVCASLSALIGIVCGVVAFKRKSLRPLAAVGVLLGVFYFLASAMTVFAVYFAWRV